MDYVYLLFIEDPGFEPILTGVFDSSKAARDKAYKVGYSPEDIIIEKWEVKHD